MSAELAVAPQQQPTSLVSKMASRFSVEPNKLMGTLKATAFRGEVSNEQMMALLIVADQYGLNPFTKELYAFPDKNNGIVPVVGLDGWARIVNEHPQCDGLEFREADSPEGTPPAWIECTIYRKDRRHATTVREHMSECKRATGPWGSHPRRMLRHKALIQCARLAFGFVGIYDQDEAERIIEGDSARVQDSTPAIANLNTQIKGAKAPAQTLDSTATKVEDEQAKPADSKAVDKEGPSYASVVAAIAEAKTPDELDAAADLIRHVPVKQQAELLTEVQARRTALGGK